MCLNWQPAFMARAATQAMVRPTNIEPWLRNHACSVRRLLTKVERIRRQAKRAFIRTRGSDAFGAASQRWQTMPPLRRSAFPFRHAQPAAIPEQVGRRRALLEEWSNCVRADLPGADRVPPEGELAIWVKARSRSGVGISTITG